MILREVLSNDVGDLLVAESAGGGEEPLAGGGGCLDSLDVGEGEVAHVNPEVRARVGDLVFGLALEDIARALVGGVQGVEGVEVVHDRPDDEGWVDAGEAGRLVSSYSWNER